MTTLSFWAVKTTFMKFIYWDGWSSEPFTTYTQTTWHSQPSSFHQQFNIITAAAAASVTAIRLLCSGVSTAVSCTTSRQVSSCHSQTGIMTAGRYDDGRHMTTAGRYDDGRQVWWRQTGMMTAGIWRRQAGMTTAGRYDDGRHTSNGWLVGCKLVDTEYSNKQYQYRCWGLLCATYCFSSLCPMSCHMAATHCWLWHMCASAFISLCQAEKHRH